MVKRDNSGQIQRSNGGGKKDTSLAAFLSNELAPQIALALPRHLDGDRMARVALTALRMTPKLALCDKYSFAGCILQAAQLGLEVNTPMGHAYLIPRNNRKKGITECTLLVGYQGFIELARRSGQVSSIYAFTAHTGDDFAYELGLDPKLRHVPDIDGEQNEKTMTFAYAVAKLRGEEDDRQFIVLSKKAVNERKARGAGGPAWRTDYLAMARKTAVRALFTWLPKSPEMAQAVTIDDAETRRAALPEVFDAAVVDQLDTMALPPPATEPATSPEESGEEEGEWDPSTGEVPPDEEARMERELAEENARASAEAKEKT